MLYFIVILLFFIANFIIAMRWADQESACIRKSLDHTKILFQKFIILSLLELLLFL